LAQAFSQLASVGTNGCGIEQHLEATKRALDGNPLNAGFVRDSAFLAVIVIADEDDCSLASSALFDGNRSDDRKLKARGRAGVTRYTVVHVPSGLRQATPRTTSGRPPM
jgi:hypothetical protein